MVIALKDLKQGDFVYCTGDSSFCDSSYERVIKVTTQYNEHTGKSYKVIWLSGNRKFDSRTGSAMNSPLAYYIEPVSQKKARIIVNTEEIEKAKAEAEYRKRQAEKEAVLAKLTPKERKLLGY